MKNSIAEIVKDETPVVHSVVPDVNREFLTIRTEGWDEIRKLTKKVLLFEGRRFIWSGWNSDTNLCFFARQLDGTEPAVAKIVK